MTPLDGSRSEATPQRAAQQVIPKQRDAYSIYAEVYALRLETHTEPND